MNLASETAFTGSNGMTHYVASKSAVVGLTRAFARELGPLGIRVNAIAPGYTDTEGGRAIGDPATYDVSATPLGRVAEPEDMVGTLLHLLGPGSAFVTGQVVLVNGGTRLRVERLEPSDGRAGDGGSTPSSSRYAAAARISSTRRAAWVREPESRRASSGSPITDAISARRRSSAPAARRPRGSRSPPPQGPS